MLVPNAGQRYPAGAFKKLLPRQNLLLRRHGARFPELFTVQFVNQPLRFRRRRIRRGLFTQRIRLMVWRHAASLTGQGRSRKPKRAPIQ